MQGVTLTANRHATAEELRPLLPALTVDEILSSPYALIGTAEEIAGQIMVRRRQLGISYITVFEKDLDSMAEVIEVLDTGPEEPALD